MSILQHERFAPLSAVLQRTIERLLRELVEMHKRMDDVISTHRPCTSTLCMASESRIRRTEHILEYIGINGSTTIERSLEEVKTTLVAALQLILVSSLVTFGQLPNSDVRLKT